METALPCPSCQSPVPPRAFACPMCTLAVRLQGAALMPVYPAIVPSAPIFAVDLRTQPLSWLDPATRSTPNVRLQRSAEGLAFETDKGVAYDAELPFMRLRDACLAVRVSYMAAETRLTLFARSETIGKFKKHYGFGATSDGVGTLMRVVGGAKGIYTPLAEVGPGAFRLVPGSVVELRVQGPLLEGLVDGRRVVVTHDAVLGMGSAGFRIGSRTAPASAIVVGFQLCGVMA